MSYVLPGCTRGLYPLISILIYVFHHFLATAKVVYVISKIYETKYRTTANEWCNPTVIPNLNQIYKYGCILPIDHLKSDLREIRFLKKKSEDGKAEREYLLSESNRDGYEEFNYSLCLCFEFWVCILFSVFCVIKLCFEILYIFL